jgi:hypothetical protein
MLNTKTVQVFRLYGNDNSRGILVGLDLPCLVDTYNVAKERDAVSAGSAFKMEERVYFLFIVCM